LIPVKYNIRSLRTRWVSSLMTILGTALVVWAVVLTFGLADGLDHTLAVSGEPLDLIIMRKGATAETNSIVNEAAAREMAALPGIASDAVGEMLCSPELVVVVNTPRRGDTGSGNMILRGVTPAAQQVRTGFQIVEGRENRPGLREAITSKQMARRFEGAGLNEELDVFGNNFTIVGLFEAGHSATESEVWTDLEVLAQTTRRVGIRSSIQIRANSADDAQSLSDRIASDEQFGLAALSEPEYYAEQAKSSRAIKVVGVFIAVVLSVGAVFAVANTMYGAVASRAREIGTLRALGFGRRTILVSFMLESLALCLAGGALGCLAALPLNGMSTGTANWVTFSELAFTFRFGPWVQVLALLLVAVVGTMGGLFPALRATRMKIVDALREI
jgi:putative ABC transport system permease protein